MKTLKVVEEFNQMDHQAQVNIVRNLLALYPVMTAIHELGEHPMSSVLSQSVIFLTEPLLARLGLDVQSVFSTAHITFITYAMSVPFYTQDAVIDTLVKTLRLTGWVVEVDDTDDDLCGPDDLPAPFRSFFEDNAPGEPDEDAHSRNL